MQLNFVLKAEPKKSGGVRYEAIFDGADVRDGEPVPFVVYFPQVLARIDGVKGTYKSSIIVEFEV